MRFYGLDRVKGVALWMVVLHHLLSWTVGKDGARQIVPGTPTVVVTDLAVPLFAVSLGAAAHLVGTRLRQRGGVGTLAVGRRWLAIGACGVVLGFAFDGRVDRVSILEILALSGITITATAALLRPGPRSWALVAAVATIVAEPIAGAADDGAGWWFRLAGDKFPIVTYLAFASWGAATAALLRDRERPELLARLTALAAGATAVAALAGAWPPHRYPGGLDFILPGVAGSLALWWVLSLPAVANRLGPIAHGLEIAGKRSLLVFVAHYAVRFALEAAGVLGDLEGPGWLLAAVLVAVAIGVAASWPRRHQRPAARRPVRPSEAAAPAPAREPLPQGPRPAS